MLIVRKFLGSDGTVAELFPAHYQGYLEFANMAKPLGCASFTLNDIFLVAVWPQYNRLGGQVNETAPVDAVAIGHSLGAIPRE